MPRQMVTQWNRRALIKKHQHLCGFQCVRYVLQHSARLLQGNAGKPRNEV